jgi:hypothetical protein
MSCSWVKGLEDSTTRWMTLEHVEEHPAHGVAVTQLTSGARCGIRSLHSLVVLLRDVCNSRLNSC